jgi:hypothetical protein
MRYFTRQLYLDFNSPDDAVADQADEAWEVALREYHEHLEGIRDRLPSNVVKLAELNLHDAEILARAEKIQPEMPFAYLDKLIPVSFWSAVGIVSVRVGDDILLLIYNLWDRIREQPAPDNWRFSRRREHWLYDEVDVAGEKRGPFIHRILLSSGVELEIPFSTVVIHRFGVHPESGEAVEKERVRA